MIITSQRDLALDVWRSLLWQPYRWGGDDPLAGVDCSGFVIEGLKAAGVLSREGDWTAAQLAERFKRVDRPAAGHLVFWGAPVRHVEVVWAVISATVYTIGASGGGSTTTSREAATAQNAYVKVRPAVPNIVLMSDPFA